MLAYGFTLIHWFLAATVVIKNAINCFNRRDDKE